MPYFPHMIRSTAFDDKNPGLDFQPRRIKVPMLGKIEAVWWSIEWITCFLCDLMIDTVAVI